MEQLAALASGWAGFDLQAQALLAQAPWLALLMLLVGGVALPAGLYGLFDRWAAHRLRVDTVALATRYGGFMNSWAVFGRHAAEYRDLRPIFPTAQAAEFARFDDGTATIAARFTDGTVAAGTAAATFGSFATSGIEHADAGLSFRTGQTARGYACGQWLLIGDTLFVFYAADDAALARRRQATPALRARRFPGPLRLLHGRRGHSLVVVLWVLCALAATTWLIEAGGRQVPDRDIPADISTLRLRLPGLLVGGQKLRVLPLLDGGGVLAVLPPDNLHNPDLDRLAGRAWMAGIELQFDARNSTVNVLSLVGQVVENGDGDVRLPEDWRSNLLLGDPDDAVAAALRTAVLAAGWTWQPRLWPWPALWRDPWHPWQG
ncbi:hypothetical protein [Ferrovibrio xuzhouensis]|uniref:Uncharacterized protein n=1 Tax=Ferrovibrio xuzhouensis TaxID=1576914 RepID=A0ABV7VIZ1_9PROT